MKNEIVITRAQAAAVFTKWNAEYKENPAGFAELDEMAPTLQADYFFDCFDSIFGNANNE